LIPKDGIDQLCITSPLVIQKRNHVCDGTTSLLSTSNKRNLYILRSYVASNIYESISPTVKPNLSSFNSKISGFTIKLDFEFSLYVKILPAFNQLGTILGLVVI